MGRPRISEPRACQLNLRFTANEIERINRRASALGLRPVEFGRAMLLKEGSTPELRTEAVNRTSRLVHTQLARLGNNLNQMVRHLHQTGDPLPADLEPLLIDIRKLIARGADK